MIYAAKYLNLDPINVYSVNIWTYKIILRIFYFFQFSLELTRRSLFRDIFVFSNIEQPEAKVHKEMQIYCRVVAQILRIIINSNISMFHLTKTINSIYDQMMRKFIFKVYQAHIDVKYADIHSAAQSRALLRGEKNDSDERQS